MKLMKHITIALVLCAIPAMAFGQVTTTCDACTHDVSVYMGEGGVIATATMDDDGAYNDVTWVATCGGVTRSGTLMPGSDGTVSALFSADDGSSCATQGTMEIGPVEDGGWYWLTGDTSSAVGGLVNQDVLKNKAATITKAGGVTETAGSGAVLLEQTSTGRMGILPTILPVPPPADAVLCGPRADDSFPYPYNGQQTSRCMLGGGLAKIRLIGPSAHGSSAPVTSGMVYRPLSGTITVKADLWLDESGSYSTAMDNSAGTGPSATSIQKGWPGKTATAYGAGAGTNWLNATFGGSVAATVGSPVAVTAADKVAGVTLTSSGSDSTPNGQATFTIGTDSSYCSNSNNHTALLYVTATPAVEGTEGANNVHPAIAVGRAAGLGRAREVQTFAAIAELRIVCPPRSSSNQGQELVPENPFPTDE